MTTFSNEQIRDAILRAADRIEAGAPYDFNGIGTTGIGLFLGGCAPCMWGHIGVALGMNTRSNWEICKAVTGHEDTRVLYDAGNAIHPGESRHDPVVAAKVLRAYANKYFPAVVSAPPLPTPESHQLVKWSACVWSPSGVRA